MGKLTQDLMYISSRVSSYIPEGRTKEWLRARFWRRYDPLRRLEAVVDDLKIMPDKTLMCRLKDGTILYGLPSETCWTRLKYIDNLGKMGLFQNYGSMMSQLCEIYIELAYERHYTPQVGDVVVDVGANVGIFTIRMARMIGEKGKVIAIEPDYRNIECLKKNIEVNNLHNVVIVSKGAWNSKGKMKLNMFSGGTGFSSFHDLFYSTLGQIVHKIEVDVDTLDSILSDIGIEYVDFIKMDIEGAELEAVEGIDKISEHNGLRMVIAAYHIINGKMTCKRIAHQLKDLGLRVIREGAIVYAHKENSPP